MACLDRRVTNLVSELQTFLKYRYDYQLKIEDYDQYGVLNDHKFSYSFVVNNLKYHLFITDYYDYHLAIQDTKTETCITRNMNYHKGPCVSIRSQIISVSDFLSLICKIVENFDIFTNMPRDNIKLWFDNHEDEIEIKFTFNFVVLFDLIITKEDGCIYYTYRYGFNIKKAQQNGLFWIDDCVFDCFQLLKKINANMDKNEINDKNKFYVQFVEGLGKMPGLHKLDILCSETNNFKASCILRKSKAKIYILYQLDDNFNINNMTISATENIDKDILQPKTLDDLDELICMFKNSIHYSNESTLINYNDTVYKILKENYPEIFYFKNVLNEIKNYKHKKNMNNVINEFNIITCFKKFDKLFLENDIDKSHVIITKCEDIIEKSNELQKIYINKLYELDDKWKEMALNTVQELNHKFKVVALIKEMELELEKLEKLENNNIKPKLENDNIELKLENNNIEPKLENNNEPKLDNDNIASNIDKILTSLNEEQKKYFTELYTDKLKDYYEKNNKYPELYKYIEYLLEMNIEERTTLLLLNHVYYE
ncbi:hypothetical protein Hokovirus_1_129 [Hokovirus HKV1]|uniref:Uncharacterized protein n=1 Tax=Hokovirus HKV1 TaxID=1977638 RepID=A0A1V0SEV0_9VIRU|nr:hypothetical protein Hokovirus_1_129 [Hokovirus HKV1]